MVRVQHETGHPRGHRGPWCEFLAFIEPLFTPHQHRTKLAVTLRSFNHMYRPHAAREDTVLFPAIRGLVGAKEYAELGEQFEDKEKTVLGDHGFERAVEEVAGLERSFGVGDLAALTA